MKILIDMDNVIADTLEYTITCLENNHIVFNREELNGKYLEDILTEQQISIMHNITSKTDFFKKIPLKPKCYEVMKMLNKEYEIRIVSCAFVFPKSMNAKLWWIRKNLDFIDLSQVIFCGCKSDIKGDILIDDIAENLQNFDGEKYIFSAPHNIDEKDYKRFESWDDVALLFLTNK